MYQVTIYDKHGAILHMRRFSYQPQAIDWMVTHCTMNHAMNLIDGFGLKLKGPVEWELSRTTGRGTVGQPWLKGVTEQYHKEKRGAT